MAATGLLSALKEAFKYGLTKDEFLPLWKQELEITRLTEERQAFQLKQSLQMHQTDNNHNLESKLDDLCRQYMQQLGQLDKKVQDVHSVLTELKNHQMQQDQQNVQTKDDICYRLQTLDNRISDLVNVTKASIEQSRQGNNHKTIEVRQKYDPPSTTSYSMDQAYCQGTASPNFDKNSGAGIKFQAPQRRQETDMVRESLDQNEQGWTLVETKSCKASHQQPQAKVSWTNKATSSETPKSVAGTGPIAETIAFQMAREMNENQARRSDADKRDSSGVAEVRSKNGKKKNHVEVNPAGRSINYIPKEGANFDIVDGKALLESNEDFFTEFFYTRPKPCRVRLRLWFNKGGRLGVQVLVAEGEFDEHHQWPLVFSGAGYVFNCGSKTYTKLWEICSEESNRPKAKMEAILGASVYLNTSRVPTDNVTYKLLAAKRYVDNDRLVFRWNLKAEESKTFQSNGAVMLWQPPA